MKFCFYLVIVALLSLATLNLLVFAINPADCWLNGAAGGILSIAGAFFISVEDRAYS